MSGIAPKRKVRGVLRGEIFFAFLDPVFGREQGGYKPRPVVVVSVNDIPDREWGLVTVVPGTTNTKFSGPNLIAVKKSPQNGLAEDTAFQCHQVRALDHSRLMTRLGCLSQADLVRLAESLKFCLGLNGQLDRF